LPPDPLALTQAIATKLDQGPFSLGDLGEYGKIGRTTSNGVMAVLGCLTGSKLGLVEMVFRDETGAIIQSPDIGAMIREKDTAAMKAVFVSWEKTAAVK
jgi:hypothetical protein